MFRQVPFHCFRNWEDEETTGAEPLKRSLAVRIRAFCNRRSNFHALVRRRELKKGFLWSLGCLFKTAPARQTNGRKLPVTLGFDIHLPELCLYKPMRRIPEPAFSADIVDQQRASRNRDGPLYRRLPEFAHLVISLAGPRKEQFIYSVQDGSRTFS